MSTTAAASTEMATDPPQDAGPSNAPATSDLETHPRTDPDLVPAAVQEELPQRIAGTDYAFLQAFYDRIPVLTDSSGKLQTIPQAQLPPYPALLYARNLQEAETNMHAVMQYQLAHNIRSENMPASWFGVLARVKHNIRALGGSYNFQIANTLGKIPKHPAVEAAAQEEAIAKAAYIKTAGTKTVAPGKGVQPGPETPGDIVVVPPVGHVLGQAPLDVGTVTPDLVVRTESDIRVALIPQPQSPASAQRQLATNPGRAQAQPEAFPLLATPQGVRTLTGMRQEPEIPTKQAQLKELERLCALFGYQTPGTSKDSEVRVTSEIPTSQFKFTEPRKLSTEWISEVQERPNVIKVYIQLIFTHLKNIRAYTPGDPFPIQFLNLVTDSRLMESLHSFVEAEQTIPGQSEDVLIDKTVVLVKRLLTGSSREPATVAKETLLTGGVKQGSLSVSQYIETFKSYARLIKDYTLPAVQEWLCSLFRKGIKPSLAAQCALTDEGKEWESLESLFNHAIKEETKLQAKERVILTDVSPSFTAKRGATVAALPAQQTTRPRLDRQRPKFVSKDNSSEGYIMSDCPRELKYGPWSQKIMTFCTQNKTCFKCRDRVHSQGHEGCPYKMEKRQSWGDYSPLHGQDPHAMQVDEPPGKYSSRAGNEQRARFTLPPPPGHTQEPAKDTNPYAPKRNLNWTPNKGAGSAWARKKRFSG